MTFKQSLYAQRCGRASRPIAIPLSAFYHQQAAEWREAVAHHRQQAERSLSEGNDLLASFHQGQVNTFERYADEDEARARRLEQQQH